MHFQLCGGCQSNRPPLFGPLGGVDGEGVFGVVQHRNQDGHFVDEGMQVLEEGAEARRKKEEIVDRKLKIVLCGYVAASTENTPWTEMSQRRFH